MEECYLLPSHEAISNHEKTQLDINAHDGNRLFFVCFSYCKIRVKLKTLVAAALYLPLRGNHVGL